MTRREELENLLRIIYLSGWEDHSLRYSSPKSCREIKAALKVFDKWTKEDEAAIKKIVGQLGSLITALKKD